MHIGATVGLKSIWYLGRNDLKDGFFLFTVALTGGIGSGKSAASDIFAELGAGMIDADIVGRALVQPGQPALHTILREFGPDLINRQGELDRAVLRRRVFANPVQRHRLEAIMHPLIRDAMWRQAKQTDAPYVMLVVPLLYENQAHYPVDRILLIDVPEAMQRARIKQRDKLDDDEIDRILASQSSRAQRLQIADDVIQNTGTLADLRRMVQRRHDDYLQLAVGRLC